MHGKSGRPSSSGVRKNRGGRLPTSLTCNALREHHAHELHGEALHGFRFVIEQLVWSLPPPALGERRHPALLRCGPVIGAR